MRRAHTTLYVPMALLLLSGSAIRASELSAHPPTLDCSWAQANVIPVDNLKSSVYHWSDKLVILEGVMVETEEDHDAPYLRGADSKAKVALRVPDEDLLKPFYGHNVRSAGQMVRENGELILSMQDVTALTLIICDARELQAPSGETEQCTSEIDCAEETASAAIGMMEDSKMLLPEPLQGRKVTGRHTLAKPRRQRMKTSRETRRPRRVGMRRGGMGLGMDSMSDMLGGNTVNEEMGMGDDGVTGSDGDNDGMDDEDVLGGNDSGTDSNDDDEAGGMGMKAMGEISADDQAGKEDMGGGSDKMGDGSDKMGDGSDKMGDGSDKMGDGSDKMGGDGSGDIGVQAGRNGTSEDALKQADAAALEEKEEEVEMAAQKREDAGSQGVVGVCPGTGKWTLDAFDVDDAIGKAILFFEAQESGPKRAGNRVDWRNSAYVGRDKFAGRDLSGGWFDAGDHLKLVFPMSFSVANLAWGMIEGKSKLKAKNFQGKTNWHWAKANLEFGLDFLLKCNFDNGEFIAQIGEVKADHDEVLKPELDDITPRTVFHTLAEPNKAGTDLLMQAVAAYAASAIALKGESAVADQAAAEAELLFEMALKEKGVYSDSIKECAKTYKSDGYEQFAFWGAAWLFKLTEDPKYRAAADDWMEKASAKQFWPDYSWHSVYMGASALMFQMTKDPKYGSKLNYFLDSHINAKNGIKKTPKGLTFVDKWGSNRHAAGAAAIMAFYSKQAGGNSRAMSFAQHQMSYILGGAGHSFIVGYGCNPPRNPHHRGSALTMKESGSWTSFDTRQYNANPITGALVGGPNLQDQWEDDRKNYEMNEVACDFNAALFLGLVMCS